MFEEMRALAANDPRLSPAEILRMATVNGARALGLAGQIGELSKNALADLIAIPARARPGDACEAVLGHVGNVSASMIDGQLGHSTAKLMNDFNRELAERAGSVARPGSAP